MSNRGTYQGRVWGIVFATKRCNEERKIGYGRCTIITIQRGSDQVLDTHVELKSRFVYDIIRQRERERSEIVGQNGI